MVKILRVLGLVLLIAGCAQSGPGNLTTASGTPTTALAITSAPFASAPATPNTSPAASATPPAPEVTSPAGPAATASPADLTPVPASATASTPGGTRAAALDMVPTGTVPVPTSIEQQPLPSVITPKRAGSEAGLPNFSHIFVIVLENREASQVLNGATMPYLNSLARRYASAGNYYGVSHPSLPNYLALTGGSTAGIASDCTDCFVPGDSLAGQLQAAGRSWKAYMEGMPSRCFLGSVGAYAQKHNPFIYYNAIRGNPALCNQVVPFTQFATDLRAQALPDFVWITPDLCHDMHDCANQSGDAWLQTWVPQILASRAWQDRGVLFITFDEGTSGAGCCQVASGGKVAMLVISPLVMPGFVSPVAYSHYSLLRTIEAAWRLPLLGEAGCPCTATMADFFHTGAAPAATVPHK